MSQKLFTDGILYNHSYCQTQSINVTPEKVTEQFQIIDIYPESDSQTFF